MPKTGLPAMVPNSVGLPGFTAMPWNSTSPMRSTTSRMRSRSPTELPPEKSTTSSARQASSARSRSGTLSGAVGYGTGHGAVLAQDRAQA